MRTLRLLVLLPALAFAQVNTLTPSEFSDGWILLFDGESLFGWTSEGGAKWRVADGVLVGDAGEAGWLRTNSSFADYILKCDFRTAADGNSGIFLRSAKKGQPHVTGFELQIWNQHPQFPTGSLVNYAAAKKTPHKPNQWNTFEVEVQGDHYVVKLNGAKILNTHQPKTKIGCIGLQYNKDKKIEFRNIKLKPLGLASIFNGKNLAAWHKVDTPRAKQPPVWSARNGMIHVEKGPGQLETEATYDDFILQLDIRTNAADPKRHPNSGVFFRGEPNGFWTGYESQIRNEYKDEDRTAPVDFGTGGIYFVQPARKVVSNDNEFFTKTIVALGRHIAIWINGYPVSDWEDPHPEGKSVRNKEAILSAGPIGLQAHDPTTTLDFKNIRIVKLPK